MEENNGQRKFSIRIAQATTAVGIGISMMILGGTIPSLVSALQISLFSGLVAVGLWLAGGIIALLGVLNLNNLMKELK